MLPILRSLKDRLLNEPTFFLYACTTAGWLVADYVDLPPWAPAVAAGLVAVVNRALVTPVRK